MSILFDKKYLFFFVYIYAWTARARACSRYEHAQTLKARNELRF